MSRRRVRPDELELWQQVAAKEYSPEFGYEVINGMDLLEV